MKSTNLPLALLSLIYCLVPQQAYAKQGDTQLKVVEWTHISMPDADLGWQSSSLAFDIDKDGLNDYVIAGWGNKDKSPVGNDERMVWFKKVGDTRQRYLIDNRNSHIEAGGAVHDIDADGDLDILQGGSWNSNEVWWWENPYPNYNPAVAWPRHTIKRYGSKQHHDQIFGDFDGDGATELVFWNQDAKKLFIADIPSDPKEGEAWAFKAIWSWTGNAKYEGFDKGDINLDGKTDLVGGGLWFEHVSGDTYTPHVIEDYPRTRSAVGDFIEGGRPEVILNSGDFAGSLSMYQWNESTGNWDKQVLIENVRGGHTLQVGDINGDGHLDIYSAEFYFLRDLEESAIQMILYGDGQGKFTKQVVSDNIGTHEGKLIDLDLDGDLDILQKDFQKEERVDFWINEGIQ